MKKGEEMATATIDLAEIVPEIARLKRVNNACNHVQTKARELHEAIQRLNELSPQGYSLTIQIDKL